MSLQIHYQIREEFSLTVSNEAESCLNKASAYYVEFLDAALYCLVRLVLREL